MKTGVGFRLNHLVVGLALLLFFCSGGLSLGQRPDSRPIEFSEPRDEGGQATNDQGFGSERRRLTDLEDRLSKTFNFFDSADSFSGAPAPRMPRRVSAPVSRRKSPGLFESGKERDASDPLSRLRELLESDGPMDVLLDTGEGDAGDKTEPDLLDSLKNDDWLVRGTLDDTFWGIPLEAEKKANEAATEQPFQDQNRLSFEPGPEDQFRSQLDSYLGRKKPQPSPFATGESGPALFVSGDEFEFGQASRKASDARREEYRALLGFGVNPQVNPSAEAVVSSSPGPGAYTPPPARAFNTREYPSARSLHPVLAADRTSLYPTAPMAPQRPSVFDPIEVDASVAPASAGAGLRGSPFYEPPRRQF